MKKYISIAVLLILCSCMNRSADNSSSSASIQKEPLYKKLNGSWANKQYGFNVTINTGAGTYSGVEMGEKFNEQIRIDSTQGNVIFFKVNDKNIVCQYINDSDIVLSKEGGIAVEMKKVNL